MGFDLVEMFPDGRVADIGIPGPHRRHRAAHQCIWTLLEGFGLDCVLERPTCSMSPFMASTSRR